MDFSLGRAAGSAFVASTDRSGTLVQADSSPNTQTSPILPARREANARITLALLDLVTCHPMRITQCWERAVSASRAGFRVAIPVFIGSPAHQAPVTHVLVKV